MDGADAMRVNKPKAESPEWIREHHGDHCIVKCGFDKPWLTIYAPKDDAEIGNSMAVQVQAALNGGKRPTWLEDMDRRSETLLVGADGSKIAAVGPMFDSRPPTLNYRESDSPAARDARARLIDRLLGVRGGLCP